LEDCWCSARISRRARSCEAAWPWLSFGRRSRSRPPDLGFLDSRLFRFGISRFRGWKSLDFLGFSRPNLYLSMGYAGFSPRKISRALWPMKPPGRAPARAFWGSGGAESIMGRA
jgi:hypothetical protein